MTSSQIIACILLPLAGYLIGSVPFAWVIGKSKGIDIRTVGSKNIGATNLGRTLGRKYFFYAFLLDAAKGFVPTLAAALFTASVHDIPMWAPLITAAACVIGHLFPFWLKFKGGKGVATSFGVVMGIWPVYTLAGLLALLIFIIVFLTYRYISLASITASLAFALLVALFSTRHNPYLDTYIAPNDRTIFITVAAGFALMILWRHRTNIARLLKGTEPKYGQKRAESEHSTHKQDQPPGPVFSKTPKSYSLQELQSMPWQELLALANSRGIEIAGRPILIERILQQQTSHPPFVEGTIPDKGVAHGNEPPESSTHTGHEWRAALSNVSNHRSEGVGIFERSRQEIFDQSPELCDIRYVEATSELQRRLIREAMAATGTHVHFYIASTKTGASPNLAGFILRPHTHHAYIDATAAEAWQLRTTYEEITHDLFTRQAPQCQPMVQALGDAQDAISRFLVSFPSYRDLPREQLIEEVIAHAMGDFRLQRFPHYLSPTQAKNLFDAFQSVLLHALRNDMDDSLPNK